jgi:FimV-like protein
LKAYVELGDKDSAKTISDEIMDVGNDEQRQQAENLLEQV